MQYIEEFHGRCSWDHLQGMIHNLEGGLTKLLKERIELQISKALQIAGQRNASTLSVYINHYETQAAEFIMEKFHFKRSVAMPSKRYEGLGNYILFFPIFPKGEFSDRFINPNTKEENEWLKKCSEVYERVFKMDLTSVSLTMESGHECTNYDGCGCEEW